MTRRLGQNKRLPSASKVFLITALIFNFFSVQVYASENVAEEIKGIINNYYINDVPIDIQDKYSINDIINNLNDPYTQILEQNDYNSIVNNTFVGIGVTIERSQNGMEVTSVMVNSPAKDAGIMEEDIIISADNNYLNELSISDSMTILNGEQGVPIELKVLRNSETIVLKVKPRTLFYPTIDSKIINKKIGYIHINSFRESTLDEFENKLNSIEMKSVDSYIIDLRYNPGGDIYSATEIAGYFATGERVAIAQIKNGARFEFKSQQRIKKLNKPIIILVNNYTASSAELLTACAQDYGTATIIGETTYGKGVAQSVFKLSDDSILKTTTLKLYSPKGRDFNNIGITPDIQIKGVDPSIAGDLIGGNYSRLSTGSRIVGVLINNKNYYINMNKIVNKYYWEVYRQVISQASLIDVTYQSNQNNLKNNGSYPILKYVEVPKTLYKTGERVTFKLSAPNYTGSVQYRAMLWNDITNKYIDLWNSKDKYYEGWRPRGNSVFTISFPVTQAGNYKIKVFVKRSGISNSNTYLKGMNSDSFVYEIPFKCLP